MMQPMWQQVIEQTGGLGGVRQTLSQSKGGMIYGVVRGQKPLLVAGLLGQKGGLVVLPEEASCIEWAEDLSYYLGKTVLHLPPRPPYSFGVQADDRINAAKRVEALLHLSCGGVCVTSIEAVMAVTCPAVALIESVLRVQVGQHLAQETLAEKLVESGFERVVQVEAAGQFAMRGGIVDVRTAGQDLGLRIEFFGDEIDSLRSFDCDSQRTVDMLQEIMIYPCCEAPASMQHRQAALQRMHKHVKAKSPPQRSADLAPWMDEDEDKSAKGSVASRLEALAVGGLGSIWEGYLPFLYPQCPTVMDYLPQDALVVLDDPVALQQSGEGKYELFLQTFQMALEQGGAMPGEEKILYSVDETLTLMQRGAWLGLETLARQHDVVIPQSVTSLEGQTLLQYAGNMDRLCADIVSFRRAGMAIALFCGNIDRAKSMEKMLLERGIAAWSADRLRPLDSGEVACFSDPVRTGFTCGSMKLAVFGTAQLYTSLGTSSKKTKPRAHRNPRQTFVDLNVGDYVVHESCGIGRFEGMQRQEAAGVMRDYMVIGYAGGDRLYVPTEQFDRVQRYIGSDEQAPRLSKMGGKDWESTKKKVRESVKELAFGLVELYAKRSAMKGFAFAQDTPWQQEFEGKFPFEETPDQLQSVEEIKSDMQTGRPMDRLLCGDVGYGKTEVALRAAFKAVQDGKQVAILVPTTILAQQHFLTLQSRMEGFPVRCEVLSRFKSPAQQKAILSEVAKGKVDVLVGTHRLLGNDVAFSDLGLLIIDEEQRFGVGHKEKIKVIKQSVDVLTLSATPIPRTLHMSMLGVRDLSVLDTPPQERYPVQTFVLEYQDALIKEAILREIGRGGQVFFVYNRIRGLSRMQDYLQALVPHARIVVGHGQMEENRLEEVMLEFIDHQADILLCTSIIENGLDIPEANTIIVFDADTFGLSQLYQLRGRVGRSHRAAYAFFTFRPGRALAEAAQKRLEAIREFTRLGSGFRIAMRDLEIRGAGNLLGAQQHGHMAAVGYALYCRMIEQEVQRLKTGQEMIEEDCTIQLRLPAYLPEQYIPDEHVRISLYRRLAGIDSAQAISDALDELFDRFGQVPESVENLCQIALMRSMARRLGIRAIAQVNRGMEYYFSNQTQIAPEKLFMFVQNQPQLKLVPGQNKLVHFGQDVPIDAALKSVALMEELMKNC